MRTAERQNNRLAQGQKLYAQPVASRCTKNTMHSAKKPNSHGLRHAAHFDGGAETQHRAKPLKAWCKRMTENQQGEARSSCRDPEKINGAKHFQIITNTPELTRCMKPLTFRVKHLARILECGYTYGISAWKCA